MNWIRTPLAIIASFVVAGFVVIVAHGADSAPASAPPSTNKTSRSSVPMWQRQLEATRAHVLSERARRLLSKMEAGEFAANIAQADQLARQLAQGLGSDHWLAQDMRLAAKTVRDAAALPADQQQQLAKTYLQLNELWESPCEARRDDLFHVMIIGGSSVREFREHTSTLANLLGGGHPFVASFRLKLAYFEYHHGALAEAHLNASTALDSMRTYFGDRYPGVGRLHQFLAWVAIQRGEYIAAESHLRTASDCFEETLGPHHRETLAAQTTLIHTLTRLGKLAEARARLRAHLRWSLSRVDFDSFSLRDLREWATWLQEIGDEESSEQLLRLIAELISNSDFGDRDALTTAYGDLASLFRSQGRHDEAIPPLQRAIELQSKSPHKDSIFYHASLVRSALAAGQDALAEATLREIDARLDAHPSSKERSTDRAELEPLRTKRRMQQGQPSDPAAAESYLRTEWQSSLDRLGPHHFSTIACAQQLGTFLNDIDQSAKAIEVLEPTLKASREALGPNHHFTVTSSRLLGEAQYRSGDRNGARDSLAFAADTANSLLRREGSVGSAARVNASLRRDLPLLAVILAEEGSSAEAWRRLEQSRARNLWNGVRQRDAASNPAPGGVVDVAGQHYRRQLVEEVDFTASLRVGARVASDLEPIRIARMSQLREALEQLDRRLDEWKPDESTLGLEVFDLPRVQQQIPDDAALVTWTGVWWPRPGDGEFWGCVLRRRGPPHWVRLHGSNDGGAWTADDLNESQLLWQSMRQSPVDPTVEIDRSTLDTLAKQRIAPLQPWLDAHDDLPMTKQIVVIHSGPTHVPLEVFLEQYVVSYAPSATIYTWLREQTLARPRRTANSRLFAVGDPTFSVASTAATKGSSSPLGGRWSDDETSNKGPERDRPWNPRPVESLPGTRIEVEAIAALFGDRATTLLGEAARESTIQALAEKNQLAGYDYLHFATHGDASHPRPWQASLWLTADDSPQRWEDRLVNHTIDGRLTAHQVVTSWKLQADLVTLSACDSALGPLKPGEHFVGFSHAFLLAGSRSIVASLWAVHDDATSLFMRRFYDNLLGQRKDLLRPMTKAEALWEAKHWLRSLTTEQLEALLGELPDGLRGSLRRHPHARARPATHPFAHPHYWAPFVLIGDPGTADPSPSAQQVTQ